MNIIERIKTDQFFIHDYVLLEDDTFMNKISKGRIKQFSKFLPPRWLDNEILKNRIVYCVQMLDETLENGIFKTHMLDERTTQTDMMIKIIDKSKYESNNFQRMLLSIFISSIEHDSRALTQIIMENGGGMHQINLV